MGVSLSRWFQDNERIMVDRAMYARQTVPPSSPIDVEDHVHRRHRTKLVDSGSSTSRDNTDSEDDDLPTWGKFITKVAVRPFMKEFES